MRRVLCATRRFRPSQLSRSVRRGRSRLRANAGMCRRRRCRIRHDGPSETQSRSWNGSPSRKWTIQADLTWEFLCKRGEESVLLHPTCTPMREGCGTLLRTPPQTLADRPLQVNPPLRSTKAIDGIKVLGAFLFVADAATFLGCEAEHPLSLIHISEPTRRTPISY